MCCLIKGPLNGGGGGYVFHHLCIEGKRIGLCKMDFNTSLIQVGDFNINCIVAEENLQTRYPRNFFGAFIPSYHPQSSTQSFIFPKYLRRWANIDKRSWKKTAAQDRGVQGWNSMWRLRLILDSSKNFNDIRIESLTYIPSQHGLLVFFLWLANWVGLIRFGDLRAHEGWMDQWTL